MAAFPALAGERTPFEGRVPRIAILPVHDLDPTAIPGRRVERHLREQVGRIGTAMGPERTEEFLRKHRVRWSTESGPGGSTSPTA